MHAAFLFLAAALAGPAPEHGLHFDTPAATWDEALPLGNGILGALVWGDGAPLTISLDRTDLWDLRPVPEYYDNPDYAYPTMRKWEQERRYDDLIRLYETPYHRPAPTKIPAGRIRMHLGEAGAFQNAALLLDDATATVALRPDTSVSVWIHAETAVGAFAINGIAEPHIELEAPAFGGAAEGPAKPAIVMGDLAQLGYAAPRETRGETRIAGSPAHWRAYEQTGWGDFRFAVYCAWIPDGAGLRGAWSVASSFEGGDPLAIARDRVHTFLQDVPRQRERHLAWWKSYWEKSSIDVPNPIIEKQWYLDTYKFGAATRRGAPPITLQGPWTADDGKLPPWKGDYHHDLNTQLSYWPCYSGNRLDEGRAYLDWLWKTRDTCRDWTRRFFGMPGLNVPMTGDLNNAQIGGWRQYTHSATTGAWLAHHFYLHWRHSADRVFLSERAYPYLHECAVFLEAVTAERGADGKRTLPLTSSPEINDNRPNAWFPSITNYDLALIRWLFGAAAELAGELGKGDDAEHWRAVLTEMPEFARGEDGALLVAAGHPLKDSHRHLSHLLAIHPLGIVDTANSPEDARTVHAAIAELERLGTKQWCGYSFAWFASLAARAGDGARAERALEIFASAFTLRNSFHANGDQSGKGYSSFTYRPFTLEGNFAAAAGLQEMLLQSHRGYIEVFPAIPDAWKDLSFANLRAQGAFLVSAERRDGRVTRIHVRAERDGLCRLRAPESGKIIEVLMESGEERNFLE